MTEKLHSKLGIASIIIGLVILMIDALWGSIVYLYFDEIFGRKPIFRLENLSIISILISIIFAIINLVGMGLGIYGWVSKKTNNLFSIIGTFFNLLLLIGGILLTVWWLFIFFIATVPKH